MKRLILLRHAQAAPKTSDDFSRALATEGRAEASSIAGALAEPSLRPDLSLVSPARRTRETWELAGAQMATARVLFEEDIYEADAEDLLDILHDVDDLPDGSTVATLILVGHNPGISDLAADLVGAGDGSARADLARGMPTAAFAVIELPAGSWREIAPGSGTLIRFAAPARSA